MKKVIYCLIVIACALALFVTDGEAQPQEKVTLKMITAWPQHQFVAKNGLKIIDRVKEISGGSIEIKYAGGPETFNAFEALDAAGRGAVDIIMNAFSYQEGKFPELGLVGIPMGWNVDNYLDVLYKSGIHARIDKWSQERFNAKLVCIDDMLGFVLATAKKPVTKMEDLKGLKIRGAGGMTTQLIGALGATAMTISAEEVTMAGERGVIDGVITPPAGILSYAWYPSFKVMMAPPAMGWSCSVFWMGMNSWKKLSDHNRKLLEEAFHKQEIDGQQWIKQVQVSSIEELRQKGMQIVTISPEELDRWRAKYAPVLQQAYLKQSGENGKELWNMFTKYMAKR